MLETFTPFTLFHLVVAGLFAFTMVAAALLGRRWRGTEREWRFRSLFCWGTIVWQAMAVVYWAWPTHFDIQESLPLHLCDVAAWVAPLALLTQRRWLRGVLYFWAIGLSTQAFFTPVLDEGLSHPKFWFFWVGHTQIVGAAIYDVVALGFRPAWRDFRAGVIANAALFAVVMPLNLAFGVNYGFVGNIEPEHPTLISRLGPWPLRVLWIVLIVHGVMLALWLVWPLADRVLGRRAGSKEEASEGDGADRRGALSDRANAGARSSLD